MHLKGRTKIAILCYADDIVLLSFSLSGIISLYKVVQKWSDFDIEFNEEKSHLIYLGIKSKKARALYSKNVESTLRIENVKIPYSLEGDFKYLGRYVGEEYEVRSRVRSLYAATHRCCNHAEFKATKCSPQVKQLLFNSYVRGSLYALPCFEKLNKKLVTAYRYAVLKFWGGDSWINIKNVNGKVTKSSTLTVLAGIPSIGEIHRFQCHSLFCRMGRVDNGLINDYQGYAYYDDIYLDKYLQKRLKKNR